MKKNFLKYFTTLLSGILLILLFQNCSELSFRSDPLSMTLVKYENRSSNKYMFLAHEGDDCHLLRHKRIHNFFFFFPINSFSKEELQEISQQKMIRYKNIMRLSFYFRRQSSPTRLKSKLAIQEWLRLQEKIHFI